MNIHVLPIVRNKNNQRQHQAGQSRGRWPSHFLRPTTPTSALYLMQIAAKISAICLKQIVETWKQIIVTEDDYLTF
jgi:hypothetical protein